jgi:hypothetical protein
MKIKKSFWEKADKICSGTLQVFMWLLGVLILITLTESIKF